MLKYPLEYRSAFWRLGLSPSASGNRGMSCLCRRRCDEDIVRCGIDGRNAQRQSFSGSRVCRRNATTIASSFSLRTVERGSFAPVFWPSTVLRLRHFATVLGVIPTARLSSAIEACPFRDHAAQCPAGKWIAVDALGSRASPLGRFLSEIACRATMRGAAMTSLAQSAFFHSNDRITSSNRGIKQPDPGCGFYRSCGAETAARPTQGARLWSPGHRPARPCPRVAQHRLSVRPGFASLDFFNQGPPRSTHGCCRSYPACHRVHGAFVIGG